MLFFRLRESLESLGSHLVIPDGQDNILLTRPTFALKAVDAMAADFTGAVLSVTVSRDSSLTSDSFSSGSTNPTASISLPSEVTDGVTSGTARILFQTFLEDSFYQSLNSKSDAESDVNSIILVADVFSDGSPVDVRGLSDPVQLQFTTLRTLVS